MWKLKKRAFLQIMMLASVTQLRALADPPKVPANFFIRYSYRGSVISANAKIVGEIVFSGSGGRFLIRAKQASSAKQRVFLRLSSSLALVIQGPPDEPVVTITKGANPAFSWDYCLPLLPASFIEWSTLRDLRYRQADNSCSLQVPCMVSAGGPDTPVFRSAKATGVGVTEFRPTSIVVSASSDPEETWTYESYVDTPLSFPLPKVIHYSAGGINKGLAEAKVDFELLDCRSAARSEDDFRPENYIGIGVNAVDVRSDKHRIMLFDPKKGSFANQAEKTGVFEPIPEVPKSEGPRWIWIGIGAAAGALILSGVLAIRSRMRKRKAA